MDFILDEEHPVTTVAKLKKKFYRNMVLKKEELNPPFRKKYVKGKYQWRPIAIILNPDQLASEDIAVPDQYFVIYYRKYFVKVVKGRTMTGSHKFELYYEVHRGVIAWLGTTIFKFNFFDKKKLKKKLRRAIRKKAYYCSEKSGEEVVQLIPEDSESISI